MGVCVVRATLTMFWQLNLLSKLLLNCALFAKLIGHCSRLVAAVVKPCKRISLPFPLLFRFLFLLFFFLGELSFNCQYLCRLIVTFCGPAEWHDLQSLRKLTLHWTSIEIARFLQLVLGLGLGVAAGTTSTWQLGAMLHLLCLQHESSS